MSVVQLAVNFEDGHWQRQWKTIVVIQRLEEHRTRSETVYAGMAYQHFFGWLDIIPPLLSDRLPYRYDVGRPIAAKFAFHSASALNLVR